jgi:hypothetical protein
LVTPVPLSVPPDQVVAPVTVTVSLPVSVPLLCVKELVVIAFPVEKFSVPPPLIFSGPTFVAIAGDVKFSVPPFIFSGPTLVTIAGDIKFVVPPVAPVPPVTLYVPV